jgi:Holliday junction resolvase RusA-like endonuclease
VQEEWLVSFTAFGSPVGQGSKRIVPTKAGPRVIEANPNTRLWRDSMRFDAAEEMMNGELEMAHFPVAVRMLFFLVRPKSHYGTGRNAGVLKSSAPRYAAVAPDLDKLARAVLDALTGTVFHDDRQVVDLVCGKVYADPVHDGMPGVMVEVRAAR